jgi:Flp pilus assembly protein TadD
MADQDWEDAGQPVFEQASEAWRHGRREDAERLLTELTETFPHRPEPYNKLGVICAELGRLDEAEHWFRLALAAEKDHPPALTNLGNILLERGQVDEAMAYYGLALQRDPDYPPAHRNLAVALRRQGDLRGSVRHLRQGERLAARADRELARERLFGRRKSGAGGRTTPRAPRNSVMPTGAWWWVIVILVLVVVAARYLHQVPR